MTNPSYQKLADAPSPFEMNHTNESSNDDLNNFDLNEDQEMDDLSSQKEENLTENAKAPLFRHDPLHHSLLQGGIKQRLPSNLDSFFKRVYAYHYEKGWICLILRAIYDLT